jgi:Na+/citrate or Na+/malate symporter
MRNTINPNLTPSIIFIGSIFYIIFAILIYTFLHPRLKQNNNGIFVKTIQKSKLPQDKLIKKNIIQNKNK